MKKKDKKSQKKADKIEKLVAKDVMRFLLTAPHRGFNHKQISAAANIRGVISHKKLVELLDRLVEQGKLEAADRGKYRISRRREETIGTIELTRDGNGFVSIPDQDKDVFVSSRHIGKALPGDTVKIRILREAYKEHKAEGEVIEIIERGSETFVGTIELEAGVGLVSPDSMKNPYDFLVQKEYLMGAKDGQKVLIRLRSWDHRLPEAEVIRVLGEVGENETEMHAILYEYGFDPEFPPDVEAEAEAIPKKISAAEIKNRRDMRKTPTFTIDPVDAKDFDDALSFQILDNGRIEVGIHIADVTHYVKPDTRLDQEAYERATSVYLVDRTVPMLPEALSNTLCSLRPNEDKLTYSAVFEMNESGKIYKEWFGRTVTHSDRRFTYEEAQEVLDTRKGDFAEELATLNKIAYALRAKRFREGSLGFEDAEVKFRLDENGKPVSVYKKVRTDSHKLIEDFMLLANKRVPEFVAKLRKEPPLPMVNRVHDRPDEEKLRNLQEFVSQFGYNLDLSTPEATTHSLHQLVVGVEGRPEQNVIQTIAIRSMQKAVYSLDSIGHYGLGFQYYTHFTSPIRRYPDIMVHRLLTQYLEKNYKVNPQSLSKACKHSSALEKKASEAERASIKYKQVEFLEDKVGMEFDGLISGVTRWGIYVELIENKCEGMIYLEELPGDYYEHDSDNYCVRGRRTGHEFHLGDPIVVRVKSTDLHKRVIDFELVEHKKDPEFVSKTAIPTLEMLPRKSKKGGNRGQNKRGTGGGGRRSGRKRR